MQNQLEPLRAWAERLNGVVVKEYVDQSSGNKSDRKALHELLNDAHKKQFDVLLIWSLDRLSREGIVKMSGYLERLKSYSVRAMSHQESWLDTSGPISDLLIAIFGWIAQQERSRIQERVKAGLRRAKQSGKILGRPRVQVDISAAKQLQEEGHSLRKVAQLLQIPRSTLVDALSRVLPQIT